jgi:DNA-binding NarL/FixJ family response regulator
MTTDVIKVILVDDHVLVREGVAAILETDPNISVIGQAADGHSAVYLTRTHTPDIAIVDIGMPKMNGITAIETIGSDYPDTATIVLSMHCSERYVLGAIKAGAKGYILKNSLIDELVQAIHTVYHGQYYLSPQAAAVLIDKFKGDVPIEEGIVAQLSNRERGVLQLIAEGHNTAKVGEMLSISVKTVESHRRNIMEKLGVKQNIDLIKYALRHGIIEFDVWIKV